MKRLCVYLLTLLLCVPALNAGAQDSARPTDASILEIVSSEQVASAQQHDCHHASNQITQTSAHDCCEDGTSGDMLHTSCDMNCDGCDDNCGANSPAILLQADTAASALSADILTIRQILPQAPLSKDVIPPIA